VRAADERRGHADVQVPCGAVSTTFATEGLDAPVVTLGASGERQYDHQDRQGSVYGLTDTTGQPIRWISYTAYGEPTLRDPSGQLLAPSSALNGFGYHGLPHDFSLGLVDMRARAYLPTLGRFLSPDPIALAGGANLFAFVDSGPLAWRDPMGLAKFGDAIGRVDVDKNDVVDLPEMLAFSRCSTDSVENWLFERIIGRRDAGMPTHTGHLAMSWVQFSTTAGRGASMEARRAGVGAQMGHRDKGLPRLAQDPIFGTGSTEDLHRREVEADYNVNTDAMVGGALGAVIAGAGYPEAGILANDVFYLVGGELAGGIGRAAARQSRERAASESGGLYRTTPMLPGYAGEHLPGNKVFGSPVRYLDEAGRAPFQLSIEAGEVFTAADGLLTTEGNYIFVMDAQGRFFAAPAEPNAFYHSSFFGGGPVAAAGEILVTNGIVRGITGHSGHYRPSADFLAQALHELAKNGVNVRGLGR